MVGKVIIQIVTPEWEARIIADPAAALEGWATLRPEHRDRLRETALMARYFYQRIAATAPWVGYLAMDSVSRELVGTCGFKGNPNAAGEVEIAYGTFPPFEGGGVATQMAVQLTEIALREPAVRLVLAHTLPERNASCRVLEKSGYRLAGEVTDPEDGRVWRWERRR